MCHFQGKRSTEAICLQIYLLVETILENIIDNSKGAAKVVSEEKSDMISMVALDNLYGLLFKGSSTVLFPFLFYFTTTIPANLTVLSPFTDNEN